VLLNVQVGIQLCLPGASVLTGTNQFAPQASLLAGRRRQQVA
jgi:hypothetical protein